MNSLLDAAGDASTDLAVGVMDPAYFVPKRELLEFFNSTFDLSLTKIEQTCTGAVACLLTEYLFPKSIAASRIDWAARSDYEYVQNYKLLQAAFEKRGVRKHVEVDRLIRGRHQDNLEMCQWLAALFRQKAGPGHEPPASYDPASVRARGKGGKSLPPQFRSRGKGKGKGKGKVRSGDKEGRKRQRAAAAGTAASSLSTPAGRPPKRAQSRPSSSAKENAAPPSANAATMRPPLAGKGAAQAASATAAKSDSPSGEKGVGLARRVAELDLLLSAAEGERDFLFEKLRAVEAMVAAEAVAEEASILGRIGRVLAVQGGNGQSVSDLVGEGGEWLAEGPKTVSAGMPEVLNKWAADAEDYGRQGEDLLADMGF